jgi:hypothetical protein
MDVEMGLFVVVLAGSFGIALGLSRLVLGLVLNAMAGQSTPPMFAVHWRRVAFVAGLFCLWYLVPSLAAAASRSVPVVVLRHLLGN